MKSEGDTDNNEKEFGIEIVFVLPIILITNLLIVLALVLLTR